MKTMQEDICDTALALGLAVGERSAAATSGGSISRRPSLTLSLSDGGADAYGPPKGAEGNRKPSVNVEGGTGRVSSPHSAVSSFSTVACPSSSTVKREKVIGGGEEAEVERASSRASDEEEEEGGARKKLRLTKEQSALLEDRFKEHSALNPKQKQILAKQLNLRPRQIEVWFQNRRARTKLKQTEVDCQFLKRCCDRLAEENRRLQKELHELKSLQFNPHPLYLQFPAATLSMCPSCERIGGGGGGSNVSDNKGRAASVAVRPFVVSPKPHFFNPFTHSAAC